MSTGVEPVLGDVQAANGADSVSNSLPVWCQWTPQAPECQAESDVNTHYQARGPWAVSTRTADVPAAQGVQVWYPTNLGSGGYRHPIVTWGNGSGSTPGQYARALDHLASWGYVVVASNCTTTGSGAEMLAATQWMVQQNSTSGSIFNGKLDTARIGSVGHSQGASGAVWSMVNGGGLIKSTIAISFPDRTWWQPAAPPESELVFHDVNRPVFYVTGTLDFLAQSDQQLFYDLTAGPAVKAALLWGGHNDIQDSGNPTALLGYITAWFEYTLEGDAFARQGFVGSSPSELEENPAWENQAAKGLP